MNNSDYSIRELKPSESKAYRKIRLEAIKSYPQYFGANYAEQVKMEKLYFERIIETSASNGIMMGAFLNETLVGICGITFDTKSLPRAGEIIQMYVQKNHQGHRLAKRLMNAILDKVSNMDGVDTVLLGVERTNTPAIKTYENCGFVVSDALTEASEDEHDNVYMVFEV